jgi:hypothetical protein
MENYFFFGLKLVWVKYFLSLYGLYILNPNSNLHCGLDSVDKILLFANILLSPK